MEPNERLNNYECYYYGNIPPKAGCWLHDRRGNVFVTPQGLYGFPLKLSTLDAGLLAPNEPVKEGEGVFIHIGEWSILSFWDRSGDGRYFGNSAFVVRGVVSFHTARAIIQYQYPSLWERFTSRFVIRAKVTEGMKYKQEAG